VIANIRNFLIAAIGLIVTACSAPQQLAVPTGPGQVQADTPPRIVANPADHNARIWDNPMAFGPVPERLTRAGQILCGKLNTSSTQYAPRGYHYKALDFEGNPMPGGGFLCLPEIPNK
jgi:hypothetical protein